MHYARSAALAGVITTFALFGMTASAQSGSPSGTQSPGAADFVTKATVAGKTEVSAARIALKNSQADDVKAFATQMIKDHSEANEKLASIAKAQGLPVPAHLDAEHRAVVDKLRGEKGAAFDAAYSKQMVADHEEAVALFKSEAAAGNADSDLRAFAQKTLPTLEHHKSMADALAAHHGSGA